MRIVFHFWFWHASHLGLWACRLFPLQTLSFAFGITFKEPCFISSDNFPDFTRCIMLTRCYKNRSFIFLRRHTETQTSYQSHNFHTIVVNELKHAQTCLYYDWGAWPPSSRAIKSFPELHSHTMYNSWQYCTKRRYEHVELCIKRSRVTKIRQFWQISYSFVLLVFSVFIYFTAVSRPYFRELSLATQTYKQIYILLFAFLLTTTHTTSFNVLWAPRFPANPCKTISDENILRKALKLKPSQVITS